MKIIIATTFLNPCPKTAQAFYYIALSQKYGSIIGASRWTVLGKKRGGCLVHSQREIEPHANLLQAAIRETQEETGIKAQGRFIPLTFLKQKSGKVIHAGALRGTFDTSKIKSNTFEMEWPPRSCNKKVFPEIDKATWLSIAEAQIKIVPGQQPFLIELEKLVNG
ncbi:NUDIX domain-containing protein [Pricia antarctica]|uniref:NUDIX domain-containing protein n=1 Tax=Pricia antarctica TaxID=641691 RepID=A0A1G7CV81_9FLAO|nr:NUDIX domain-containing protein [Pricia antarctica]SDE43219.1 NUDIX domain-containing protein [Pricia antarctica]